MPFDESAARGGFHRSRAPCWLFVVEFDPRRAPADRWGAAGLGSWPQPRQVPQRRRDPGSERTARVAGQDFDACRQVSEFDSGGDEARRKKKSRPSIGWLSPVRFAPTVRTRPTPCRYFWPRFTRQGMRVFWGIRVRGHFANLGGVAVQAMGAMDEILTSAMSSIGVRPHTGFFQTQAVTLRRAAWWRFLPPAPSCRSRGPDRRGG